MSATPGGDNRPENINLHREDVDAIAKDLRVSADAVATQIEKIHTSLASFGDFPWGRQLAQTHRLAHEGAVDTASSFRTNLHGFSDGLDAAVQDLEDTDQLNSAHFVAIARADRGEWKGDRHDRS
ncbi:hypothetical protein [Nocardioides sp. LHG3406-4]|uniref:hypothetical protein n=1 Tax=Nocardioides sp. LHG3406-4 TaxID=2804575 RepID=UPI003CF6A015